MSRWIDADEFIDDLYEHEFSNWCDKDEVSTLVNDAPSIDIVRCGECKWNASDGCFFSTADRTLDDFCSYGSRSEKPNNSTISKMEQVETMSCAECKHRPIGAEICEEPCHYEPQTDWHYDEQDATWYPYKHEDEPQTCSFSDCDNFKNPDYERCIECKRKQREAKGRATDGKERVMKWKPIKGATNAPKGMRWWNNGESRFGGNYRHELRPEPQPIGKGTDETQTDARHQNGLDSLRD